MTKGVPDGCKLRDDYEEEEVLEPGHWTVANLIAMLQGHDQDARVWIVDDWAVDSDDDMTIHPMDIILGNNGEVFL